MIEDRDGAPLTPWERDVVARMEEELGPRDEARRGPVGHLPTDPPGPMLLVGAGTTFFGIVVAFTAGTPLGLAGWILLLIGLVIVWEQL